MDAIKFAIVGCGRISKNHIDAIEALGEGARLVAVCDIIEERAKLLADERGIPYYKELEMMLDAGGIDVLSICTPSGLHPEHGILAAKRGIHVLTEKPMGTSIESAEELIRACDDNEVKLFVVKQNRLNDTTMMVKKAIDEGRFGKLYMATANVFWTRPQSYYDDAKWRGTWELDGGAFMNQASHYVDMVEWLMGPVESVMAYTDTLERNIEAEDSGVAILRFRNGAMASINVTMLTFPKNLEGSITILGERGTVKLGGVALNRIDHWEFADYQEVDDRISDMSYATNSVYGFGHQRYYEGVIRTINLDKAPDIDGREGKKSLETIISIYNSAREGKLVWLPFT